MDSRILILAIPSALIFVALIWHSLAALPRRRAIAFWVAVILYGVLRGFGVRFVTETIGGGATDPNGLTSAAPSAPAP